MEPKRRVLGGREDSVRVSGAAHCLRERFQKSQGIAFNRPVMKLLKSPWIRLALFGLLCFLLILASQISWDWSYRTASGVPRSYAPFGDEVRREDGSVDYRATLNRLLGEPLPPEKNAAVVFAKLAARGDLQDPRLRALVFKTIGFSEDKYAAGAAFFEDYRKAEKANQAASESTWAGDQDHPQTASWLDRYPNELAELRAACQLGWYVPFLNLDPSSPVAADLLPLAQSRRIGARMLLTNAFREAGRGNIDAATTDIVAVHLLGLNSAGQVVIEDLIGVAVRGMAILTAEKLLKRYVLSEAQLRELAKGFQRERLPTVFTPEIGRGERYLLLDALQGIERNQFPSGELGKLFAPNFPGANLFGLGYGPFVDRGAVLQNLNLNYDIRSQCQQLSEIQGNAVNKMLQALKAKSRLGAPLGGDKESGDHILSFWLGIAFSPKYRGQSVGAMLFDYSSSFIYQTAAATIRVAQQRRLLELAIALERYQRTHGSHPDSLDQLVPEFLPHLPLDQFAERGSFGYQRLEDGFRVFANPSKPSQLPRWPGLSFEIVIDRSKKQLDQTSK